MPNAAWSSLKAVAARPRLRRAVASPRLAAALVTVGVLGFLVAPLLAKPWLEQALSHALARKVTIGQLAINPFAVSTTLGEIAVAERGDGPPLLTGRRALRPRRIYASLFRFAR